MPLHLEKLALGNARKN